MPLLSPLPSPLLLLSPSPVTPIEPISIEKVNKGKDKNIKEPVEVEDEDIGLPPLPLPARFIRVWKVVIGSKKESPPSIRLALFNTKSIYYFNKEWYKRWPLRSLSLNFTLYLVKEKEKEPKT